jgi:hypothetical protein
MSRKQPPHSRPEEVLGWVEMKRQLLKVGRIATLIFCTTFVHRAYSDSALEHIQKMEQQQATELSKTVAQVHQKLSELMDNVGIWPMDCERAAAGGLRPAGWVTCKVEGGQIRAWISWDPKVLSEVAKDDIKTIELHTGRKIDMTSGDFRSATVGLDRLVSKGDTMTTPLCAELPAVNPYRRFITCSINTQSGVTVEIGWYNRRTETISGSDQA